MIDADAIRAAATVNARTRGCTCNIEITIEELEPNLFYTAVHHDDRCPLLLSLARRTN